MAIGKRLKAIREERGLSQTEVGKLTKMHPQDISKYESERAVPSVDRLKRLAHALQISTDYLIFDGERKGEIEFVNPDLRERVLLISKMSKKDQEAIIRLLDGMIIKNKIKGEITPHLTED